ncbi:MAG: hypothetical protein PHR14_09760 [Oscillospiraceae bacterium]|nr:hypothetical protein [Oscillospiraceae bacterium]
MSKYLKQKRFYADDELDFWLDECYFHPSKDKEYPSVAMKKFTRYAMRSLWGAEEINVFGLHYSNQDIRRIMIEEMTPEYIDTAVSMFKHRKVTVSLLPEFMFLIFFETVNGDKITEELFRITYPQAMNNEKFVPPPHCKRNPMFFRCKVG